MATLEELREETRRIDRQLLELIAKRTTMGHTIVELKRQKGMELYDEAHIREVLQMARDYAKKNRLHSKSLQQIFDILIEMRMHQELEDVGQSLEAAGAASPSGGEGKRKGGLFDFRRDVALGSRKPK
ncbi:MAG: chorismate mutase [Halobacteria archaeon]